MKKLFEIGIGCNPRTGQYVAVIQSLTDNKHRAVDGNTMRVLMTKISKLVRKKNVEIKCFPLPKPRRVTAPNGNGTLMEPARN